MNSAGKIFFAIIIGISIFLSVWYFFEDSFILPFPRIPDYQHCEQLLQAQEADIIEKFRVKAEYLLSHPSSIEDVIKQPTSLGDITNTIDSAAKLFDPDFLTTMMLSRMSKSFAKIESEQDKETLIQKYIQKLNTIVRFTQKTCEVLHKSNTKIQEKIQNYQNYKE